MHKLSTVITTLNNEKTLEKCLKSVSFSDEIILLDSYSNDQTLSIAEAYHCRISQQKFAGYGQQKQAAVDKTKHRWVLLLDADEALTDEAQVEIQHVLANNPQAAGYSLARWELMFWKMQHPWSRLNYYLRLFDKTQTQMCDMPIHAAPKTNGQVVRLKSRFMHFGEPSIHVKIEKINAYSSGLVSDKRKKMRSPRPWLLILYPPWFFIRLYLFKRLFLSGWGGFITAVSGSFYVFLKYAKLYESFKNEPND